MKISLIEAMSSSAAVLITAWSVGASAQDAPPTPVAPTAQTDAAKSGGAQSVAQSDGLPDILVTARRRVERLQDVPVAATAFTKQDLARYQSNSFQQIASQIPQLQIGDTGGNGGAVISLRGVGAPDSGPSIDQAVSINVDGIQFSQAQVLRLGLYDIDRVEVLKGPQALFYGKNSPGGVIAITSNGPSDHFEASLRGGYEFANERKYLEAMVSGPITETIGARLDAAYGNQNGWFRNDSKPIPAVPVPAELGGTGQMTDAGYGATQSTGPDQRDYFIRGTLSYKSPGGFVDGVLKVSYGKIDRDNGIGGYYNQLSACAAGVPQFVALLGSAGSTDCKLDRTYNEPDIAPAILALSPYFRRDGGKQFYISDQFLTAATVNFHLSDHLTLTSVSGYYDLKEAFTGNFAYGDLDFVEEYGSLNIKQYSQEFRLLSSFSSPLNFMLGTYYQHVDNTQRNFTVFGSPLIEPFTGGALQGYQIAVNNREAQTTEAYSVFGQAILDLTSKIQLTAGGRYSYERKNVGGDSLTPQVFLDADFLNVPFSPNERSFRNFSPEVTLRYKPLQNVTVYGAYRTGFKSGGFDLNAGTIAFGATSIGNVSFNQEKVQGFEVGAKGNLFNRQLVFDFATYHYKYSGLQVAAFDPLTFGYRITNAASAIVQGVELATRYRPAQLRDITLRGTINYNDAHYASFSNAPCYVGQSIAAGCAFIDSSSGPVRIGPDDVGTVQDLSGRSLSRAPAWTGNIGATYEHLLSRGWTVSASADGIYTDSFYAEPEHDIRSKQPDAWRLNASISLQAPGDRWEIALIGTNLTQQTRGVNGSGTVGTGSGTGTANAIPADFVEAPSEVRTISIQATMKFK